MFADSTSTSRSLFGDRANTWRPPPANTASTFVSPMFGVATSTSVFGAPESTATSRAGNHNTSPFSDAAGEPAGTVLRVLAMSSFGSTDDAADDLAHIHDFRNTRPHQRDDSGDSEQSQKRGNAMDRLPNVVLADNGLFTDTAFSYFPHATIVLSHVRITVTHIPHDSHHKRQRRKDDTVAPSDDVPTVIESSSFDQDSFDAAVSAAGQCDGDWIIRGRLCGVMAAVLSAHKLTDIDLEIFVQVRGGQHQSQIDRKLVNTFAVVESVTLNRTKPSSAADDIFNHSIKKYHSNVSAYYVTTSGKQRRRNPSKVEFARLSASEQSEWTEKYAQYMREWYEEATSPLAADVSRLQALSPHCVPVRAACEAHQIRANFTVGVSRQDTGFFHDNRAGGGGRCDRAPPAESRPCRTPVADRLPRLRGHHVHDGGDQGARGEVLARAALHVLGVLLQQPLVGVALHVGGQARPLLLAMRSTMSRRSLAGSWILFCALRKMTPSIPFLCPVVITSLLLSVGWRRCRW